MDHSEVCWSLVVATRQGTSCSGCLCSRQQVSGKSTKCSGWEKNHQQGTPPPEQPGRHAHLDHRLMLEMDHVHHIQAISIPRSHSQENPQNLLAEKKNHQQGIAWSEQPGRPAHTGHKKMLEMDQPCALEGRQLRHKNCNPLETWREEE